MPTTLVTGATGLIGNAIVHQLVLRGDPVRALVRDPERAAPFLPLAVELARGDVTDPASLAAAMRGADRVYHAAGMPEQWVRDEAIFDRVNRQGTRNVLEAALAAQVRRVIYTSTMDVFAAPRGGVLTEAHIDPNPKPSAYERSKQAAEREAEVVRARGLDVVYVNPSSVYGPAPFPGAMNTYFAQLLQRKLPGLPPGGCSLVYVEGAAQAHLAAADRGINGERYLLADAHASMVELGREICRQAGLPAPPAMPEWVVRALAAVSAPPARWFGFKPLVAPGELQFLLWNARVDSGKARRELGLVPLPLAEGVRRTIEAMRAAGVT